MVEVVHPGDGELVCHGQPMALLKENSVDASKEKHVPVVDPDGDGHPDQGRYHPPPHGGEALH